MPSYAKLIKPVINNVIIPLLFLFSFWKCWQYQGYFFCQNLLGGSVIVIYLFLIKINKWHYYLTIGHKIWNVIRWIIAFIPACI